MQSSVISSMIALGVPRRRHSNVLYGLRKGADVQCCFGIAVAFHCPRDAHPNPSGAIVTKDFTMYTGQ